MDAAYFLRERTTFIRGYYDRCVGAFRAVESDIEDGRPPFDNPPWDDSGEPAFLSEWMDAEQGIEVTGLTCVSLLADALKLYFNVVQHRVIRFKIEPDADNPKGLWKDGFVTVYRQALREILAPDGEAIPVDFDLIEQVVLARNRAQHGVDLTSLRVQHDAKTLSKYPRPFFTGEGDLAMWQEAGGKPSDLFAPNIVIDRDRLFAALTETERLASWVDDCADRIHRWRHRST